MYQINELKYWVLQKAWPVRNYPKMLTARFEHSRTIRAVVFQRFENRKCLCLLMDIEAFSGIETPEEFNKHIVDSIWIRTDGKLCHPKS